MNGHTYFEQSIYISYFFVSILLSKGSNVYFVGMMGSGKTTVTKGLANLLPSYSFLDTDAIFEEVRTMAVAIL